MRDKDNESLVPPFSIVIKLVLQVYCLSIWSPKFISVINLTLILLKFTKMDHKILMAIMKINKIKCNTVIV